MVFSSIVFLCAFLPVTFILYCLVPNLKVRNGILLLASLAFYAYGEPVYVLIMIASSLINYTSAVLIAGQKNKKFFLIVSVILNLGILCVFKYTGFLVENLNGILHLGIPAPEITMPIGISFFTFQAMSYVIDVYNGKVGVQKNYLKVLLYISFFPQLIAGPIVKYRDISDEIEDRHMTAVDVSRGLQRFIRGLAKKVLIANTMGLVADHIFEAPQASITAATAWLGAIVYMLQIYYDFSGYSDMAIGLGRMFGFHFLENFNFPYGSTSIKEFWRRWHISLSGWFREYLYIPLGGNRKGKSRTSINKIIVFFCTGLWHGASWTFVLWGLYHGLFLLIEDAVPAIRRMPKVLGHIYTLIVVCVGFVLFRAETLAQGLHVIGQMFTGFAGNAASASLLQQQLTPWFLAMLIAALILAAPVHPLVVLCKKNEDNDSPVWVVLRGLWMIVCLFLLGWCILRLSGSSYNPFIYFRF